MRRLPTIVKIKTLLSTSLLVCTLCGAASAGTLFDFRNNATLSGALDNNAGPISFTNAGLIATFTASDGAMNITGSGFGLNSSIPGDDTDAFDVGEWIDITFDSAVTLTNIDVSSWSTANSDKATIYVNGVSNGVITSSGSHPFNINVPDGQTLQISSTAGAVGNGWSLDSFTVDVGSLPTNNAPVLGAIGDRSVTVSNALNFAVSATDSDNDPIVLSVSNLPPGAVFNTVTNAGMVSNSFSWAVAAPTGTYTTTFYADDGTTNDFETITISVTNLPAISDQPPELDSIGDKEVFELDSLSFAVTASDPVDGDPITLTATNLPTGAVFSGGIFTWSNAAPAGAYDVTFTATDKDGSDSETVTITVTEKPVLFISEIADPAGTGADAYRFVEIYNAGSSAVDLADGSWHLERHNNGTTWYSVPLTGTVAAAETYVVAKSGSSFFSAYSFYPDQVNSGVDGNGNDSYSLYQEGDHTSGTLVDIYGEEYTDGIDTEWEYTDGRVVRNNNILEPNTTWTASEWTITAGATTNDMTPGAHGPAPEFQGLENQFVFLGDDLHLLITAVNTVKTDTIILSATVLPAGAAFPQATGTNSVSSTLSWTAPTAGVYTVTFAAEGLAGTTTESITVTVAGTAEIDGKFYGWENGTIVKLDNGQFWRNTGGAGSIIDPPLRNPQVSVTNVLGTRRMFVETVASYTTVERIAVTESSVVSTFTGLHNGNIYELADGTFWQQISFENISSSADPVTAWRWTENSKTYMRFLNRDDVNLGTCQVAASAAPTGGPIITEIDGWFRGWKNKRVFALANGEFWQQTVADSSVDTLYRPAATLTNWLDTGTWRLTIDGASAPGYVEVQQLTNVTRTAIDGWFYGFGNGEFFHLQNDEWWRQTSLDTSASTRANPEVLIWNDNGTDIIEMPDEGRAVSAEQLNVITESTIIGTFRGLRYAHYYNLASDQDWAQISSENIPSDEQNPSAMVWADDNDMQLLARDSRDLTIGSCTVIDPLADDDNDGVPNIDEMIAGTSLLDRNDFFYIGSIYPNTEGRAVLRWPPVSGRTYTIEWTASLLESFQPLETLTDWTQDIWIDTVNPPASGGFYRLRVQLEN